MAKTRTRKPSPKKRKPAEPTAAAPILPANCPHCRAATPGDFVPTRLGPGGRTRTLNHTGTIGGVPFRSITFGRTTCQTCGGRWAQKRYNAELLRG